MPINIQEEVKEDDVQTWMPEDVKRALDCEHFPVVYYDENLEGEVFENCVSSEDIGLTHMRLGVGKNILVCLTTEDKIYVLDMTQQKHVELLRELLKLSELKFFTVKGHHLAYSLNQEFHITLKKTFDVSAFDVFLQMRRASINCGLLGQYTITRLSESQDDVKYNSRYDLAKKWLNVDLPDYDRATQEEETAKIRDAPNSVAAMNAIRKRSCLTRALAIKMRNDFDDLIFQDSHNIYEFAHKVSDEDYIEYENLDDDSYDTMMEYLMRQ